MGRAHSAAVRQLMELHVRLGAGVCCLFTSCLCVVDSELCERELEELSEALKLQLLSLQENIGAVRKALSKLLNISFTPETNQSPDSRLSEVRFKASICRLGRISPAGSAR